MSADVAAILGVGVALAGLMLALFRDLKGDLKGDLRDLRRRVDDLGERLARIEGAVLGPATPPNRLGLAAPEDVRKDVRRGLSTPSA